VAKQFAGALHRRCQVQLLALPNFCTVPTELFISVLCDESGHTKFPFSCLAHVTLLTLALAARLRVCSGLLGLRKAAPQQHNSFKF